MKSNLRIMTSFVSPKTMEIFINEGYLPIFILRSISNSTLIGKYSNTPIHFKELSPSSELFHQKRDKLIDFSEFKKRYLSEISSINLKDLVSKLENLANISNAKGVVLLGYGSDYKICHRSILSDILNESGLLTEKISEIQYDNNFKI